MLRLLLVAAIAESLTIALSQRVSAQQRVWRALTMINLPRDLAIPGLALVWAPPYGAPGLAWAYVCGRLIGMVGTAWCGSIPQRAERRLVAS